MWYGGKAAEENAMSAQVPAIEVVAVMERIARGELVPRLADASRSWGEVFCGDVEYVADGWTIVIFNDCDEYDYVDSVTAPDGRSSTYSDWSQDQNGTPDHILWQKDELLFEKFAEYFESQ